MTKYLSPGLGGLSGGQPSAAIGVEMPARRTLVASEADIVAREADITVGSHHEKAGRPAERGIEPGAVRLVSAGRQFDDSDEVAPGPHRIPQLGRLTGLFLVLHVQEHEPRGEAAVMVVERRRQVTAVDLGQPARRDEPLVQRKAAAVVRWHEPYKSRLGVKFPEQPARLQI